VVKTAVTEELIQIRNFRANLPKAVLNELFLLSIGTNLLIY